MPIATSEMILIIKNEPIYSKCWNKGPPKRAKVGPISAATIPPAITQEIARERNASFATSLAAKR
ncbi:Uncharacterised protein [Acinetobacter baumannii]|nr:Uncharacterised protein [Acinetobacter baumannii]